ncbi:hypothetical protein KC342_g4052 [Hortaea werneckii]|nr:hypothetical protein KC342_g4052 [Hortaea werneckii]
MASTSTNKRSSYMPLSVQPVYSSSTADANASVTPDSPPESPASSAGRPPTPGGGPLTSHPTNPNDLSGAFPPTPDPERESQRAPSTHSNFKQQQQRRESIFKLPISPASASPAAQSPEEPPQNRRASGVRKLLSLSSLRSSFNSSRTSLSLPQQQPSEPSNYHPWQSSATQGTKRPASPSMASTDTSTPDPQQPVPRHPLRSKKSGTNWFKRKSSLFMMSSDNLTELSDENSRPHTRESKRLKTAISDPMPIPPQEPVIKERTPPPVLPQIGNAFNGGELGWDEDMFKD